MSLFINLLGGFSVAAPAPDISLGLERKRTRALLALLAFELGRMVPRGKLTALLWDDRDEEGARHALRQCVLDLRQALAKVHVAALRSDNDLLGLDPSRVTVDVAAFQQSVSDGKPETLQKALRLYRGDLLEGFVLAQPAFEEWLRVERDTLRSRAVGAMRRLLSHNLERKASEAAIEVAIRLVTMEPYDESMHRMLMRLYAESGRRSAALRQYEECVDLLARDLRTQPEAETKELYRSLVAEPLRSSGNVAVAAARRRPGARPAAQRAIAELRSVAPFIGRQLELTRLETLQQKAKRGHAQLALVVGEAGMGKSRLVHEFASRVQRSRGLFLFGRGREGEDVLPFAPWIEAIRPVLNDDVLRRLAPATRRDFARLFPELADGPAPNPGGLEDGPRIFEAVAHYLLELASEHPLVVVIEDLHWCDDMTTRLLRFLPRRLEGEAVVLAGTARPEELVGGSRRDRLLGALRQDAACVSIMLGPLSQDETMQLLRSVLSPGEINPPAPVADRVWRLSEGNPFVVIECGRALRDPGSGGGAMALGLPDQVRALTERCFTDLSDSAARLGDIAAVIGRDFEVPVLRHAARVTEAQLAEGLEELVRRRVLRELAGRFDFCHDRVREVAYARLLGPRRALLHRQVAEALEKVYRPELGAQLPAIGTHYRQASLWAEAATYLARAGFQAWERGAGREALACFEDALDALGRLPDVDERRELHVHLRVAANGAHVATGSYERGRQHLFEAEKLAVHVADRRWAARVAAALANSLRAAGAHDRSLVCSRRALDIAREIGDRQLECVAQLLLGSAEHSIGNFRASLTYLLPGMNTDVPDADFPGPFLAQVDRHKGLRDAFGHWIVLTYVELGEFQAGMQLVERWLEGIDVARDAMGTSRLTAYIALGRLHNAAGDFNEAVVAYEKALALYRDDCHAGYGRPLRWGLGLACTLAGDVDRGLDILEKAAASERRIGSETFVEMLNLHLGRAYLMAGRLEDATRTARVALTWSLEHGDRAAAAGAHGLLGDIAGRRQPVAKEDMEAHLVEALTQAQTLEMRALAARCHLGLARLYATTGHPGHNSHAALAAALIEEMGNPRSLEAAAIH